MLRGKNSAPKNVKSGIDNLGLFRKSKSSTGRAGGVKLRGPYGRGK